MLIVEKAKQYVEILRENKDKPEFEEVRRRTLIEVSLTMGVLTSAIKMLRKAMDTTDIDVVDARNQIAELEHLCKELEVLQHEVASIGKMLN